MRIVESQGQARTHCTMAHDIAGGWRGTRTKATAHCSALQLEFTPHAGRLRPCGSEKIGHGSVGAIKHNPATPLACTLVAAMAGSWTPHIIQRQCPSGVSHQRSPRLQDNGLKSKQQASWRVESGQWTVVASGQWTVESGEHMQFGIMEKTRTKSHEGIHCDIFLKGYGLHLMTTT